MYLIKSTACLNSSEDAVQYSSPLGGSTKPLPFLLISIWFTYSKRERDINSPPRKANKLTIPKSFALYSLPHPHQPISSVCVCERVKVRSLLLKSYPKLLPVNSYKSNANKFPTPFLDSHQQVPNSSLEWNLPLPK